MPEENPADPGSKINKESVPGSPPVSGTEPASATPRRYVRSKRRRNILIAVAALAVLVVGAVFLWRYLSSYESTDDAQVDVHLYPVSARISGYVVKVNVDDNQYVQQMCIRDRNERPD